MMLTLDFKDNKNDLKNQILKSDYKPISEEHSATLEDLTLQMLSNDPLKRPSLSWIRKTIFTPKFSSEIASPLMSEDTSILSSQEKARSIAEESTFMPTQEEEKPKAEERSILPCTLR